MKFWKLVLAVTALVLSSSVNASLVISDYSLTDNSISFNVTGTIDGPAPEAGNLRFLFLVDVNGNGNYDTSSVFDEATITSNISVNGVSNGVDDFWIENDDDPAAFEDRLTMNRDVGWADGDVLSGIFSATWTTNINSSAVSDGLEFRWGRNNGTAMEGALQGLGVAAVPIPGAVWLFGSGLIGLIGFAKRNRGFKSDKR